MAKPTLDLIANAENKDGDFFHGVFRDWFDTSLPDHPEITRVVNLAQQYGRNRIEALNELMLLLNALLLDRVRIAKEQRSKTAIEEALAVDTRVWTKFVHDKEWECHEGLTIRQAIVLFAMNAQIFEGTIQVKWRSAAGEHQGEYRVTSHTVYEVQGLRGNWREATGDKS